MPTGRAAELGYELRLGSTSIKIGTGMLSIGRNPDCNLVLDSPKVSAHHALICLKDNLPMVFDLGSTSGVFVNGIRVRSERVLADGDKVLLGDRELRVVRVFASEPVASRAAETVPGYAAHTASETLKSATEEDRNLVEAVQLMGAVAEKLIDAGDSEKAVKMLGSRLISVLEAVRGGRLRDGKTIESAAFSSLRLAGAAMDPAWIDHVVLLYDALGELMPRGVIEVMHQVVPRARAIQLGLLRGYVTRMQESHRSEEERFLLQRLSAVERIVAGR